MTKNVFITGIGGFIGTRLAQRCRERGWNVSGCGRTEADMKRLRALGYGARVGDITHYDQMRDQLAGVDVVFHTAAVAEGGSADALMQVNVEGSATVARAARDAGVRAFVHFSSVMVYGFDYPEGVNEDGPLDAAGNLYCRSKIEGEKRVLPLQSDSFGVIVIRPGDVYGPGSGSWIKEPVQMLQKQALALPRFGKGIMNPVYVDNLIDGVFLAVDREAYGEVFNITDGKGVTFAEFYRRIAQIAGVPGPTLLPTAAVTLAARALHFSHQQGWTKDAVNVEGIRFVLRKHPYSIEKARRRLGYEPKVPLAEGIERCREFARSVAHGNGASGSASPSPTTRGAIVVTGCASGIGRAVANELFARGYNVVVTDLNGEGLEKAAKDLGWSGSDRILQRTLDVTDFDGWQHIIEEAVTRWGTLDTLIHCAGFLVPKWAHEFTVKEMDRTIDINTKGTMYGTHAALAKMLPQGHGHIINIASMAALLPVPGAAAYSASKHAARAYTIAVANEVRDKGVYLTAVCPGAVNTPMAAIQVDKESAAFTFAGKRLLETDELVAAIVDDAMKNKPLELIVSAEKSSELLLKMANAMPTLQMKSMKKTLEDGRAKQLQMQKVKA